MRASHSRKRCQKARKGQSPKPKTATTATDTLWCLLMVSFCRSFQWIFPQTDVESPSPKVCESLPNLGRGMRTGMAPTETSSVTLKYRLMSSPKNDHSNRIYCYTQWETRHLASTVSSQRQRRSIHGHGGQRMIIPIGSLNSWQVFLGKHPTTLPLAQQMDP